MSASVPESNLTKAQLAALCNFRADLATAVDRALVDALVDSGELGGLNVRDFGALGDGVTDDVTAIRAAFASAGVSNLPVHFPKGTYKITGAVTVPDLATVQGVNATIKWDSTAHKGLVLASGASRVAFRGMAFEGNTGVSDYTVNQYEAIYLPSNNVDVVVRDCRFSWVKPINVGGNSNIHVGRLDVTGCRILNAPNAMNVTSNARIAGNWFVNDAVIGDRSHGIYVFGEAENIVIVGNFFKFIDGDAIKFNNASARFEHKRNAVIANNYFDGVKSYCVWLGSDADAICDGFVVTGNNFRNCATCVHGHNVSNFLISNNAFIWDWEAVVRNSVAAVEIASSTALGLVSPAKNVVVANNVFNISHPFMGKVLVTGVPSDGNTVTVAGRVYTWRTTPSVIDDVQIVANDPADCADQLMKALRGAYDGNTMNTVLRGPDDAFSGGDGTVVIVSEETFTISESGGATAAVAVVDLRDTVSCGVQAVATNNLRVTDNTFDNFELAGVAVQQSIEPVVEDNTLINCKVAGIANIRGKYNNEITWRRNRGAAPLAENLTALQSQVSDGFPVLRGDRVRGQQLTNPEMLGASAVVTVSDGKAKVPLFYGSEVYGAPASSEQLPFRWNDGDTVALTTHTPTTYTFTFKRTSPGAGEFNTAASLMTLINGSTGGVFTAAFAPYVGVSDPQLMIVISYAAVGTSGNSAYVRVTTKSQTCGQVLLDHDAISPDDVRAYLRGGNATSGSPLVGATKTFVWSPIASTRTIPQVHGVDAASYALAPRVYTADIEPSVGFYITCSPSVTGSEKFAVVIP